jgi:hypothetical protein
MAVTSLSQPRSKQSTALRQCGDEVQGFTLELEELNRLIRVRLWGVWETQTAEQFLSNIVEFAERLRGSAWGALIDGRRFVAQSPKITAMREATLPKLAALGCSCMANVVTSAAYQMQFSRITAASHIRAQVFLDEITAREWLVGQFASGTVRASPKNQTTREGFRAPSGDRRKAR